MKTSFTDKQAERIHTFMRGLGVPEESIDTKRLVLFNYTANQHRVCDICGHRPIKHEYHLKDKEFGGDMVAGSECILTYLQIDKHTLDRMRKRVTAQQKKRQVEADAEAMKRAIKFIDYYLERLEKPSDFGGNIRGMLSEWVQRKYNFTEGRRKWAEKVYKQLATMGDEAGIPRPPKDL